MLNGFHRPTLLRTNALTPGSSGRPRRAPFGRLILGLSYAFADFVNAHGGEDAVTEHSREQHAARKRPYRLIAHEFGLVDA